MGALGVVRSPERVVSMREGRVRRNDIWPWLILGGWLVQVAVRLILATGKTVPIFIPDESGYLIAARLISGGVGGDLSGGTFYQAGYPLLVSPAYWLTDDPVTVYRLVIAINALIGGLVFVLAYAGLRCFDLPRVQAYAVAMVTGLLPSAVYFGQFALTDAMLPVLVLGWLLSTHRWVAFGRAGAGAAAAGVAAYACCAHSRGLVIVAMHAAVIGVAIWRRWVGRRQGVVVAGVLAAGVAAGWALNAWVRSQIYPRGTAPLGTWLTDRLTSVDGWGWTFALAAGKIWYLIVATWGVAGIGLVALVALSIRAGAPRPARVVACLVLLTLVGMALATSAATPDEKSVGNFAYGRYLSCLAPILFMAGAVFAVRCTKRTAVRAFAATVGIALVTGLVIELHAGERLFHSLFTSWEFPEICVLTWNWSSLNPWSATWTALLILAATAFAVASGRRDGLLIAVVGVAVLDLTVVSVFTDRDTRGWERLLVSATSLAPAGLAAQDHVAEDFHGQALRIWVSHSFLVRNGLMPFDRYRASTLPVNATLAVVPWDTRTPLQRTWPAAPSNWRPVMVHGAYGGGWVAWRRMN